MDFSRSKDVAMFFATCSHDPVTESYFPLQEGTAVLYTADLKRLIEHRKGSAAFLPLGLEPLPRPEAQGALTVRLNAGENLNDMPWVIREAVEITPELSQHYFDMFNGGENSFLQIRLMIMLALFGIVSFCLWRYWHMACISGRSLRTHRASKEQDWS